MRLEVTKSHSTDRMRPHKYRGSLHRHPGVFCCWGNYCWLAIDLWRGHYSVCFNLWFHYVIWWLHPSATPGNYPLSRPGLPPLNTTSVLLWESPGSCYLNALPCNQRFVSGLACSMCGVVCVAVRLFTPLRGKKSSQIRECQRREWPRILNMLKPTAERNLASRGLLCLELQRKDIQQNIEKKAIWSVWS